MKELGIRLLHPAHELILRAAGVRHLASDDGSGGGQGAIEISCQRIHKWLVDWTGYLQLGRKRGDEESGLHVKRSTDMHPGVCGAESFADACMSGEKFAGSTICGDVRGWPSQVVM